MQEADTAAEPLWTVQRPERNEPSSARRAYQGNIHEKTSPKSTDTKMCNHGARRGSLREAALRHLSPQDWRQLSSWMDPGTRGIKEGRRLGMSDRLLVERKEGISTQSHRTDEDALRAQRVALEAPEIVLTVLRSSLDPNLPVLAARFCFANSWRDSSTAT